MSGYLLLFLTFNLPFAIGSSLKTQDIDLALSTLNNSSNIDINQALIKPCFQELKQNSVAKNCKQKNKTIKHCELIDETTDYCFDGIIVLNDSLGGSANKAMMEIICPPSEVEDILPPHPIKLTFGSCSSLDKNISQLDFDCKCESINSKLTYVCLKKEGL